MRVSSGHNEELFMIVGFRKLQSAYISVIRHSYAIVNASAAVGLPAILAATTVLKHKESCSSLWLVCCTSLRLYIYNIGAFKKYRSGFAD